MITAYADANDDGTRDPGEPETTATQAWLLPATTSGQVTGRGHIPNPAGTDQIAFGFTAKSSSSGVKGECELVDPSTNTKIHCADATVVVVSGRAGDDLRERDRQRRGDKLPS